MSESSDKKERRKLRKLLIGIGGGALLLIGIIAIPYPGPGWAIVFVALAILAQEFPWAQRVLDYTKARYEKFQAWVKRQNLFVKTLFWLGTAIVVILTVYLLNGYGLLNDWLHLRQDWLKSPLL